MSLLCGLVEFNRAFDLNLRIENRLSEMKMTPYDMFWPQIRGIIEKCQMADRVGKVVANIR
ncbi:hypothetical protein NFB65_14970 [Yersinia ruckeri]|nr:hypothetical protein [Yersinia ruckeri]MCW6569534.1 hypothetical protein [Yersinia ruckeri]